MVLPLPNRDLLFTTSTVDDDARGLSTSGFQTVLRLRRDQLSLPLDLDTGMGPVMNVNVYKAQVLLLGSLLFLPYLSASPPTPHASQISGGGRLASTSEEDSAESLNAHPRGDAPPMFYRALSRRSVGRYVLATSSLVGECARVYAPAPLTSIASCLCSRFSIGWDSNRGRDIRGSLGKRNPSGLSYEKFMSSDKERGDEEDGDPTAIPVPPDKYGRVSSAFLVRHEIGGNAASTSDEPAEKEETSVGVTLSPPVLGGASPKQSTPPGVDRRRLSTRATAGSVFKSLGSLGRDKRRKPAMDDMDLLSDSEDPCDGWDEEAEEDILSSERGNFASSVEEDSVQVTSETTVGRNLVDVDDAAMSLVNKLRLGKNSGAAIHRRNRRKTRRERGLDHGGANVQ